MPFHNSKQVHVLKIGFCKDNTVTIIQRKNNEVAFFIGKIEIFIFYKMSDAIKEC